MEDREGNVWVGTSADGLHRLKPKKLRLVTTADGLTHNVVLSLAEDAEGAVWLGSNGGGLSVGRYREAATTSASAPDWEMDFAAAELSYLLDNESLPAVLAARDGTLWLGTWNSGLFRKRGANLDQFNLTRPESDEPVVALCEDGAGGVWVGTHESGLMRFKDGVFTSHRSTNGVAARFITALAKDATGRLWVGTGGEGLSCLAGGAVKTFTAKEGLAGDFVRAIYPDAQGRLWVGMSGGLKPHPGGQGPFVHHGAGPVGRHGFADPGGRSGVALVWFESRHLPGAQGGASTRSRGWPGESHSRSLWQG
jgi:hypothetical protein